MLGRGFDTADEATVPGLTNIVLSHQLWQSRFGGDASVVGRSIRTATGSAMIRGVMPPEFRVPDYAHAWIPMGWGEIGARGTRYWRVVGRLRRDRTVEMARDELNTIAARLAEAYPKENRNWSVEAMPFARSLVRDVRRPLWILMGAVAFVVVIACANVAGLALARSAARQPEMAVRAALGASRSRLLRQLLVEGLLVSIAGTAVGLLVARWSVAAFFRLLPQTAWSSLVRYRDDVHLDATVLLFTAALSTLTAVALTLTPITESLKRAIAESVRSGGHPLPSRRDHRVYRWLVAGQFACAIILLAGAGLMAQSFVRMLDVERGYDPSRLLIVGLPLPAQNQQVFLREALDRVTSSPGVESAAVMSAPRFGQLNFPVNVEHRPLPDGDVVVRYSSVTADYFRVLKAPLLAGRGFDAGDHATAPRVVVINATLARQYLAGEDPVGRRLVLASNNQRVALEIIGVAGDIRQDAPGAPVRPEIFVHWPQAPWLAATLVVRAEGSPSAAQQAVRTAIRSVNANLPAYPAFTLNDIHDSQLATPRLYTTLFGAFAAVAVGLAALGIYGLFAYIVGRRTNEIAVRVALGGQRSGIVRMVIGEGLRLSLAGIGFGVLGAMALGRLMRSLLFEVSPTDPLIFGGVVILLGGVAVVASYVPARRAALTDPIAALHRE
jgi:putative ABC transport system permease protein